MEEVYKGIYILGKLHTLWPSFVCNQPKYECRNQSDLIQLFSTFNFAEPLIMKITKSLVRQILIL